MFLALENHAEFPFVRAFRNGSDDLQDKIVSKKFEVPEHAIVAYKASPAMESWPTFSTSKQISAIGSDVLCLPDDRISQQRRQDVLLTLRSTDDSVMLLGAPGIGKSSEMNFYLREFVAHMGEKGWFSTVLYRDPERLIVLRRTDDGEIETSVASDLSLKELSSLVRKNYRDAILLLEMEESETDPVFFCKTLLSLSSRAADSAAKTMYKRGDLFFVVSPPSPQQVELMAQAVLEMSRDKERMLGALGANDTAEALQVVRDRVEQIGPVSRHVLGNKEAFLERYNWLLSCDKSYMLPAIERSNVFDVHASAKFFVAPFVLEDAQSSRTTAATPEGKRGIQIRFLSDNAAVLATKAVKDESDRKLLSGGLLDYQIAEAIMHRALFDASWRDDWELHEDVGLEKLLSAESKLNESMSEEYKNGTLLPVMQHEIGFRGKYLLKDLSRMEDLALYRSLSHNAAVCESFAVSHRDKRVFAFQSTAVDLPEHAFQESTLRTFMEYLGLDKHEDYKLCIVVFADIAREKTHGCAFRANATLDRKKNPPLWKSLNALRADLISVSFATEKHDAAEESLGNKTSAEQINAAKTLLEQWPAALGPSSATKVQELLEELRNATNLFSTETDMEKQNNTKKNDTAEELLKNRRNLLKRIEAVKTLLEQWPVALDPSSATKVQELLEELRNATNLFSTETDTKTQKNVANKLLKALETVWKLTTSKSLSDFQAQVALNDKGDPLLRVETVIVRSRYYPDLEPKNFDYYPGAKTEKIDLDGTETQKNEPVSR